MRALAIIVLAIFLSAASVIAQTSTGTLHGRITDPSGAVIPKATVTATSADGKSVDALTNNQGTYEFKGLAPGNYTVTALAKGFATDQELDVKIAAGQTEELDI